jgi:hypothetical protein
MDILSLDLGSLIAQETYICRDIPRQLAVRRDTIKETSYRNC